MKRNLSKINVGLIIIFILTLSACSSTDNNSRLGTESINTTASVAIEASTSQTSQPLQATTVQTSIPTKATEGGKLLVN